MPVSFGDRPYLSSTVMPRNFVPCQRCGHARQPWADRHDVTLSERPDALQATCDALCHGTEEAMHRTASRVTPVRD